jgi:CRP/FNR family transcriptional regulator
LISGYGNLSPANITLIKLAVAIRQSVHMKPIEFIEWNAVSGALGDVLQWLPEAIRVSFGEKCHIRTFSPGQFIFHYGDRRKEMYRILQGTARISIMRSDGLQMVYALGGAGECLGASTLIDGDIMPHTAEALDDVKLQVLSAASFHRLRDAHREFDDALLRLMCSRMRLFSAYMANTALAGLPSRVALRLLEVARIGSLGQLTLPIGQSALAMLVGASRQTTNKILKQFEKDGLVQLGYGSVELLNLDALRRLAKLV